VAAHRNGAHDNERLCINQNRERELASRHEIAVMCWAWREQGAVVATLCGQARRAAQYDTREVHVGSARTSTSTEAQADAVELGGRGDAHVAPGRASTGADHGHRATDRTAGRPEVFAAKQPGMVEGRSLGRPQYLWPGSPRAWIAAGLGVRAFSATSSGTSGPIPSCPWARVAPDRRSLDRLAQGGCQVCFSADPDTTFGKYSRLLSIKLPGIADRMCCRKKIRTESLEPTLLI
jgi:hypothetical protein